MNSIYCCLLPQYKLTRRGNGYGFSIHGPHPLTVGSIKVASPAEEAGLRHGDVITCVNGQTVHEMEMSAVAMLIRYVAKYIIVSRS